jgi:hypothetical protein
MKTVSRHTICSGGMTGASALHWYWNRVLSGGSLAEVTGYRRATPPVNKYFILMGIAGCACPVITLKSRGSHTIMRVVLSLDLSLCRKSPRDISPLDKCRGDLHCGV